MFMKIGVLSDTHMRQPLQYADFFERLLAGPFADVAMILHAGDLVDDDLVCCFGNCPVHAVRGNMDTASSRLPAKRVVGAGRFSIGLCHGWGPPEGLERRVLNAFSNQAIDCLVYGHSHAPVCRELDGVLLLNPGSAVNPRGWPHPTVGLLEVGEGLSGRIIPLS